MELMSAVASIIVIDIALSGDNAVVIGMAAHSLPPQKRRLAIVFGAAAAVVLRITITSVATVLLQIPVIKLVGGLLLVFIAFKLLKQEEEEHDHARAADSMLGAIVTILLADFVMSLDNALAIAAVAKGNIALLAFGLMLSLPIVMFTGSIIAELINRFWWLTYLGSGLIAWTGSEMVLEDAFVHSVVSDLGELKYVLYALTAILTLTLSHWLHRRQVPAAVVGDERATISTENSSSI